MIYDGLDISYVDDDRNGFTFSESFRSGVINLGFHNCAFHDNTGFVLDYRILNGAGPVNFNMINTSLRRNTISSAFILHEFTPPAQYNFINTVITEHFDDETPRGLLHFIHSDTDTVEINVVNSILWDEQQPLSYDALLNNNVVLDIENSNLREVDSDMILGFQNNNGFSQNPNFVNASTTHPLLPISSPMRAAGIDVGLPFDPTKPAPDLGVNQNLIRIDSIIKVRPDCGDDNGSIEVIACYPGPLEFILNDSLQVTPRFDNLGGGLYELRIKNACGSENYVFEINYGFNTEGLNIIETPSSCGEANGSIELQVPSEWLGYQYAIGDTTSFQSSVLFDNLGANVYPIYVKTPDDCVHAITVVSLNSLKEVKLDTSFVTATTCGMANGSVELLVENAIGTTLISVNGEEATQTLTYSALMNGNYTFVVTDDEGCQDSITVIIPAIEAISILDTLVQQPTCGLENGSITPQVNDLSRVTELTVNGVMVDLSLSQSLAPGSYTLVVTDVDGCTDEVSIVLEPSTPISFSVDSTATTCALTNGIASVTNAIGNPDEFSMDRGPYVSNPQFTGLEPGTHLLIARNSACADSVSFSIADSETPDLVIQDFEGTDCGERNGNVDLTVISGTGPYNYNLDTLNNASGSFESLPAGEYIAYVEDFLTCQDSTDVSIASSAAVILTGVITEGVCGELGTIELMASFGESSNEISEENGTLGNGHVYGMLEGGEYIFYVRTAEDCLDTLVLEVNVYGVPELEIVDQSPDLCQESVGKLIVSGKGGKGVLNYTLDGVAQAGVTTYDSLAARIYTIQVSDETGCTSSKTVEVESTSSLSLEDTSTEQIFCGDNLNTLSITPSGGTGILTYSLADLQGNPVDRTDGLPEGQYLLSVIDEVGCEAKKRIIVLKEDCQIYIPTTFSPGSDGDDKYFKLGVSEQSNIFVESFRIFDRWGNLVYDKENINPLNYTDWWDGTTNNIVVNHGVYVYVMKLGGEDERLISGTVTIIN